MDRNDDKDLGPNAHPAGQGEQGNAPQRGEGVSGEAGRAGGYGYDRPADSGGGGDAGTTVGDSPIRNDNHVQSNINGTGSNRPNERDRATGTPLDERTGTQQ